MRTTAIKFIGLLTGMLGLIASRADGQAYEIRLVNKSSTLLQVEMRETQGPSPRTTDTITDVVFGIRWSGGNVDLSGVITTSYNMRKSGVRSQKNGVYYQAFYAEPVGFAIPVNWQQNEWVEILSIGVSGSGVASFQIADKGFDVTTDPNFALNFNDYTPAVTGSPIQSPLPVNLTRFDAQPANRMIQVQWWTDNEQNSKGFQVQRSDERGVDNFKDIGWVNSKGSGTGRNEYTYLDKDVISKIKYHYRLKQLDRDGQFKYSEIRTAVLDGVDDALISISPNPADKLLQVAFSSGVERGNVVLKIVDGKGAVVLTQSGYMSPGGKVELNVMLLPDGAYFLVVENKNGLVSKKLFKKG